MKSKPKKELDILLNTPYICYRNMDIVFNLKVLAEAFTRRKLQFCMAYRYRSPLVPLARCSITLVNVEMISKEAKRSCVDLIKKAVVKVPGGPC